MELKRTNPFILLFFSVFEFAMSNAQSPNWSEHIAPILFSNCVTCHRPGEIAPFPLLTYLDAVDHAIEIEQQTQAGTMPPWPADLSCNNYLDEDVLTQTEIDLISEWLNIGAPEGDPYLAPDPPFFPIGSQIGTPDTIISMSQSYVHPGDTLDYYKVFAIPSGFLSDKNVTAIELRPGNNSLVHHAFIYYDTTGIIAYNDSITPGYGLDGFGSGIGNAEFITLYRPGMKVRKFPMGFGYKIPAGADIILQIHYAPVTTAQQDSTSVNFFFTPDNIREVTSRVITENNIAEPDFLIPANQQITFHITANNNSDQSLLAISPHMHYLGVSYYIYSVNQFNDTTPLLCIPDWDFHWQLLYNFQHLVKMEDGDDYYAEILFDNTTNNINNPNDPPVDVGFGISTTDEMCRFFLLQVPYQPGDEDIVLDSSLISNSNQLEGMTIYPQLYPVSPSPASENCTVQFYLPSSETCSVIISDLFGRIVAQPINSQLSSFGFHVASWNVSLLPAGIYSCTLSTLSHRFTKLFSVQR